MNAKQTLIFTLTTGTAAVVAILSSALIWHGTMAPQEPQPHYIPACVHEDGEQEPRLPCIWEGQTPDGRFILYTR